jgi:hypothetical protein
MLRMIGKKVRKQKSVQYLYIHLSIYLSIYLSISLSIYVVLALHKVDRLDQREFYVALGDTEDKRHDKKEQGRNTIRKRVASATVCLLRFNPDTFTSI